MIRICDECKREYETDKYNTRKQKFCSLNCWKLTNREKIKEYHKNYSHNYYLRNKDKIMQQTKDYYLKHKNMLIDEVKGV